MITRSLLTLGVIVALTYATRSFIPRGAMVTGSGAALAFGFLLVAAVQMGHLFDRLRLPHLTGYILCGLLFGPELIGLVTTSMLADLALVKGTAVGLIAFLAGCELNLRRLRPRLRAIGLISALSIGAALVLLFVLFYAVTFTLPISEHFSTFERLAAALVCANVLAAFSPAVAVGLISETKASGPLSETVMSIVVLADLVIVVAYALSSSVAHSIFPGSGSGGGMALLVPHIFGSIAAGALAGAALALYVRRVGARSGIFAFALLFIAAEAGAALRALGIYVGARVAARWSGIEPVLARRIPFGLFPQAGVAIALASLVLSDHKPWGSVYGTILLGTIVVNELIAPVLFRNAIVAAGEANA